MFSRASRADGLLAGGNGECAPHSRLAHDWAATVGHGSESSVRTREGGLKPRQSRDARLWLSGHGPVIRRSNRRHAPVQQGDTSEWFP